MDLNLMEKEMVSSILELFQTINSNKECLLMDSVKQDLQSLQLEIRRTISRMK